MLLRYLYTMSKLFYSISNVLFFDIGVFFAWSAVVRARLGTHIAVYTIYCSSNVWPVAAYSGRAAPNVSKVKFGDDVPVRSPEAASSLENPPPAGAGGGAAEAADPSSKVRLYRFF